MAFIKTLLIILLVYYLIKIVMRWFGPRILSYAAKRTEAHFKGKFEDFYRQNNRQQQNSDEVVIEKEPGKKGKDSQKVGEYIDFEEIE